MTNADIVNAITNALGSPHFDPDQVIQVLAKAADENAESSKAQRIAKRHIPDIVRP